MLKELINRVRGQVWLRVTCPYPERVLNLCSARKLAFWEWVLILSIPQNMCLGLLVLHIV